MKDAEEENLQQWLESKEKNKSEIAVGGDPTDMAAYEWLFKGLAQEPDAGLPFRFADKVSDAAKARYFRRSDRRFSWLLAVLILSGVLLAVVSIVMLDHSAGNILWKTLMRFKWIVVLAVAVFTLVQFMEQRTKQKVMEGIDLKKIPR